MYACKEIVCVPCTPGPAEVGIDIYAIAEALKINKLADVYVGM